jgi:hypothetical protein
MKRAKFFFGFFLALVFISCRPNGKKQNTSKEEPDEIVAAYVWPSCHDESMVSEKLWSSGIGEWEMIQKATPHFEGHYQPRIPLWGYQLDDDPNAWKIKINAAKSHKVNTFIFDWYWYDGQPFLEKTVTEGFLEAQNNKEMNFYLMWANHDVPGNMWNQYRYKNDSLIWTADVDWKNYEKIVDRIIDEFFTQENYLKIEGAPIISIYSLEKLLDSFNDMEGVKKAFDHFRAKVRAAGFPALHIQLVGKYDGLNPSFGKTLDNVDDIVEELGINSVTLYNMAGNEYRAGDYLEYGDASVHLRDNWYKELEDKVPFIPCVSVGWDNSPRYNELGKESIIYYNDTPQNFSKYLTLAKTYLKKTNNKPNMVIINAWNEWVEGSYLEPDEKNGYGYLQAVNKVFADE